uniref:BAALC binder of MAP3K1 and KLF4 b n=1 Tax=Haplochromis burtoni TaxID=8153 RepID=A0A3Q2WCH1_HAPBU
MGCGGSRADAIIEPRYHESWTRETESTWLTNTDVETPLPVANMGFQIFSQQSTRDSKRRSSKEASALRKTAVVCSDLRHKHLQTSPSKDLWMLHLRCAIANACAKKRVGSEQCSHFTPCFSPMLMVPVRECVTVFSQCEEKKQNKKEEKKKRADCPICT